METLKKIQKHVILVVLCGILFTPLGATAAAAEGEPFAPFLAILDEVRTTPYDHAVSLEVGDDDIPSWLDEDFNFPSFELDDFLCRRAEALIPEAEVPEPETSAVNDYVRTGEIKAEVAFFNYLSQKTAFQIIVDTVFKRELEQTGGEMKLLNPEFTRVGIAIRAGLKPVDGVDQNAYFFAICFGSSQLRSEMQVLTMINEVRAQPAKIENYLGVSFSDLLNGNLKNISAWSEDWYSLTEDSIFHALEQGYSKIFYPPLLVSPVLHAAAQGYSRQLVDLDPALEPSPLVLAPDAGYDEGPEKTEFIPSAALPVVEATSARIANDIFKGLVRRELESVPERGGVFSRGERDGGVGIAFASVDDQVNIASVLAAAVGDEASEEDDGRVGIYGVVYYDDDENQVYTPGEEGLEPASVAVFRKSDDAYVTTVVSDLSGHFDVALESGLEYRFEVSSGELVTSFEGMVDRDLFLPVKLPPVPDPDPVVDDSLE